jgi:hypothetical protein
MGQDHWEKILLWVIGDQMGRSGFFHAELRQFTWPGKYSKSLAQLNTSNLFRRWKAEKCEKVKNDSAGLHNGPGPTIMGINAV